MGSAGSTIVYVLLHIESIEKSRNIHLQLSFFIQCLFQVLLLGLFWPQRMNFEACNLLFSTIGLEQLYQGEKNVQDFMFVATALNTVYGNTALCTERLGICKHLFRNIASRISDSLLCMTLLPCSYWSPWQPKL